MAKKNKPAAASSIRGGVKVFFLTPTDRELRSLRRYVQSDAEKCPVHGYHNASVAIGEVPVSTEVDYLSAEAAKALDSRWPTSCDCGYVFTDTDEWQDFRDRLYTRSDGGPEVTIRDAPPGACWDATWMHDHPAFCGPDGRSLHVKCPDGREWCIDGRASNCTMKDDKVHKCWVRHGSPENGDLTVDKRGLTCAAGAGSIDTGSYHGFLRNGAFT